MIDSTNRVFKKYMNIKLYATDMYVIINIW